jgi:hypothetical protein
MGKCSETKISHVGSACFGYELLTIWGLTYIYIICGYQTSHHQVVWHKTLLGKRLPCLVDVVHQCIVVLSVTLLYFLRDQVSMHPREAD